MHKSHQRWCFNIAFPFRKWRQWQWQFLLSQSLLIPMQTSKTTCDSRSVLEYNDLVNCALGKDVIEIKLQSVHRDIAASCQPRQYSPCLSWFSHLWANRKPNAQWAGWLICAVIHSHCMILFCIYYFREGRRDVIAVMNVLNCISSFIPSFIICPTCSFVARQMLKKCLDPDRSVHKCTLAFLLNLQEQCLAEVCLGPDFVMF